MIRDERKANLVQFEKPNKRYRAVLLDADIW